MRKKHFLALAAAVSSTLDRLGDWSEPGTAGRMVGLDVAEDCILSAMAEYVGEQGGDRARWRAGVIRKYEFGCKLDALCKPKAVRP